MIADLRPLLRKELRQARRNRGALWSGLLAPTIVLGLVGAPLVAVLSAAPRGGAGSALNLRFIQLVSSGDPLTDWILPSLVVVTGLILPTVGILNAILLERERGTHQLLAALPLDDRAVFLAKALVVCGIGFVQALPLVVADGTLVVFFGVANAAYTVLLVALAAAALVFATGLAVVVAMTARDLRTASNVVGLLSAATFVSSAAVLIGSGLPAKVVIVAVGLATLGIGALGVGLRRQELDRYFS